MEEYAKRVAPLSDRVVGTAAEAVTPASTEAGESPLGDFVADGQRNLAGADFALVATGGLRTAIVSGPVTYGEIFSLQPSGRDHLLAVSGLRYVHDPSRPLGRRVTAITLPNGDPVEAGERYSVAVNGFLAAGGADFDVFTEGERPRTIGTDIGALARHARDLPQPFVAPDPPTGRT